MKMFDNASVDKIYIAKMHDPTLYSWSNLILELLRSFYKRWSTSLLYFTLPLHRLTAYANS